MCKKSPQERRAREIKSKLPRATRPNQTGWLEFVTWPFRLTDHEATCRWRRFCSFFVRAVS